MIIVYATKEIRDCVLRDLWLEVSAGCFEGKIESCKDSAGTILLGFENKKQWLTIGTVESKKIVVSYIQKFECWDLDCFSTICNIIDFLKAGAKK